MAKTKTEVQCFSISDIGQIRTSNQDFYGNKEEANLFLVADGMGGHAGGERASHLAVDTILQKYDFGGGTAPSIKSIKGVLTESVKDATRAIYDEAAENQELQQMGTTIVALVVHGVDAILAHVGDSRIYRFRDSHLEQLTVDHSFVQEQIDAGIISEKDSRNHRMKNVITRALGIDSDVEVDIDTVRLREGDVFLLCTDGLHGMVTDADIAEILRSEPNLEKCCKALIDHANQNGGKDNVTVTLVRVGRLASAGVPTAVKAAGLAVGCVAVAAVARYVLFFSSREKPVSPGEGAASPVVPEEAIPASGPAVNEQAADMLVRAAAEIEKDNPLGARIIIEELLAFCMVQECNLEIADIEEPRLRSMTSNAMSVIWANQNMTTNEKIHKHEKQLEKYAPEQLDASLAKVAKAEVAFESNELFRALSLLHEANQDIDDAISVSREGLSAKEREARTILLKAEREIAKIAVYTGEAYTDIGVKREIEQAKLAEAQRRLEDGSYGESAQIADSVITQTGKILAEAIKIEKSLQAAEQRRQNAEAIVQKAKKKWNYINSEEFAQAGSSLSEQQYNDFMADHSAYEELVKTGDYEEIAARGEDLIAKADALMKNTGVEMQKRIAEAETALEEKNASPQTYDKADLALAASMLEEAKVLADMQFLAKAFDQLVGLEQLITGMKEKEQAPPEPVVKTAKKEKDVEQPRLSALELKKIVRASEQTAVLQTYLQRVIELLNENKKTRAKSLLYEHSQEKFETIASLLDENQKDLNKLIDKAHALCFDEEAGLEVSNIESALSVIQILQEKLDFLVTANQG